MKNNINWGIIGLGNIALTFARAFKEIKNGKLLAVSSNSSEKLRLFQDEFNIEPKYCFDKYEKLIDCKDIDIIYIALPHAFHQKWINKCIEKKKNILVEKPAFINLAGLNEIEKKIYDSKIYFCEGFMYRYSPHVNKIIDCLKKNYIGIPLSMTSNFGTNLLTKKNFLGFKKKRKINKNNRLFNKELGGGAIWDLGCYTVSISILVASTFLKINFDTIEIVNKKIKFGDTNVDIDASADLKFENEFISNINTSFLRDIGKETTITGTEGTIKILDPWHAEPSTLILEGKINKKIELTTTNIFYNEINSINNDIINKIRLPSYPGVSINESIGITKLLHKWLN